MEEGYGCLRSRRLTLRAQVFLLVDLEAALTKDHVDAPTILLEKKKKEGAMSRAKKNIASKTATSALGKKVPAAYFCVGIFDPLLL